MRQQVVGLAGTHGKTTATSMMVHVLAAAGRDAGRLVGAPVAGRRRQRPLRAATGSSSRSTRATGRSRGCAPPRWACSTSRPTTSTTTARSARSRRAFAALVARTTGPVALWADDPGAARVAGAAPARGLRVGEPAERATWRVSDVERRAPGRRFTLRGPGRRAGGRTWGVTGAPQRRPTPRSSRRWPSSWASRPTRSRAGSRPSAGAPRRFELRGALARRRRLRRLRAPARRDRRDALGASRDAGYDRDHRGLPAPPRHAHARPGRALRAGLRRGDARRRDRPLRRRRGEPRGRHRRGGRRGHLRARRGDAPWPTRRPRDVRRGRSRRARARSATSSSLLGAGDVASVCRRSCGGWRDVARRTCSRSAGDAGRSSTRRSARARPTASAGSACAPWSPWPVAADLAELGPADRGERSRDARRRQRLEPAGGRRRARRGRRAPRGGLRRAWHWRDEGRRSSSSTRGRRPGPAGRGAPPGRRRGRRLRVGRRACRAPSAARSVMNAGGHGSNMAASAGARARPGAPARGSGAPRSLGFGYRTSALRPGRGRDVGRPAPARAATPRRRGHRSREIVRWRREHQPGGANAGSVFRNPPGDTAGASSRRPGCKGAAHRHRRGLEKHANFIQADPGGRADDVYALIDGGARARCARATRRRAREREPTWWASGADA